MFPKIVFKSKGMMMLHVKMEIIATNSISEYVFPGTRVKSLENHY